VPHADAHTAGSLAQAEPVTMDADPNTGSMAVPPRNTAEKDDVIHCRVDDIDTMMISMS
jgi:hypothetical protein